MSVAIADRGDGRVAVSGALTFASLSGDAPTLGSGTREADLGGVDAVDSAGLALLIGWLADAKRNGATLRYTGIPERLIAIARISEVDALLTGSDPG